MLIFIPESPVPDDKRYETECSNGKQRANAGKEAQRKQNACNQFGCLPRIYENFSRRCLEQIPVQITVHDFRPENLMAMVHEEQAEDDTHQADRLIGRRGWRGEKLHGIVRQIKLKHLNP